MTIPPAQPVLSGGLEALAAGRWEEACTALGEAVAMAAAPADEATALDGLAEALWWLGRPAEAAAARERAFVLYKRCGNIGVALRVAAWLSREYGGPLANASAARGWLARGESLAGEGLDPCAAGWLALARAERAPDRRGQAEHAQIAVEQARESEDRDLEILALARLGIARVALGEIVDGVSKLDEAMAAATAGEAERLSTVAEVYCQLVVAADLLGDAQPFGEWAQVVAQMSTRRGLPVLMEFCECCQAEVSAGSGDAHGAEAHLRQALAALEGAGLRARCVSPAVKLADLWISQGRLAEAERVLSHEDVNDALLPRARLALARGDYRLARGVADRLLRRHSDDVLAGGQALGILAESALALGDVESARTSADRLRTLAEQSPHPRLRGLALVLQGRVAAARGHTTEATDCFEAALDAALPGSPESARAHLELARIYGEDSPELAIAEARAALGLFESAGAARDADAAASVLRALGDHSRVGAKGVGVLSVREREVLLLVAQGLSNAEIARQLFISTKTVGHHVSSILAKLGLRNRAEATSYALLHAENGELE